MNKIIKVINTIITNAKSISDVQRNGQEYFFLYQGKYKWSISNDENNGRYVLHLYPDENVNILDLAKYDDWHNYTNFITYRSDDFKSVEAKESFRDLYEIVKSKIFGVDKLLDEILGE